MFINVLFTVVLFLTIVLPIIGYFVGEQQLMRLFQVV